MLSRVSSFHRHPPRPSSLGYAVQSLGMCCEERSSCDSQRRPLKKCVTVRHTQTQLSTTRTDFPSFLPSFKCLTHARTARARTVRHETRRTRFTAVSYQNVVLGPFVSLDSSARRSVGCGYAVTMNARVSSFSVSTGLTRCFLGFWLCREPRRTATTPASLWRSWASRLRRQRGLLLRGSPLGFLRLCC